MPSCRRLNFLVFVWALLLLTSCNYQNVEVRNIRSIQINRFNQRGIDLTGEVKVYNPNTYKIKIKSTDADLYLNGRKAGKIHLTEKVVIPPHYDDYIPVHITADFKAEGKNAIPITQILLSTVIQGSTDFKIVGQLKAGSFIFSKKIDFKYENEIEF